MLKALNRILTSNLRSPAFWVIALALIVATIANIAANRGLINESSSFAQERTAGTSSAVLIREGSSLPDLMGTFRVVGERLQFVERDGGRTFRCLENLMLQRVQQVIGDELNETDWIANGKVTEFRGENFLLIEMIRRTK